MAFEDQARWDDRYRNQTGDLGPPELPDALSALEAELPPSGTALEIACGTGSASVWLALQGFEVNAVDISPIAIATATGRAAAHGVSDRCSFAVADLDDGLPNTTPVDLVLCSMFRDPALDAAMIDALVPGGLLAVSALSEVGATPGRFRAKIGELTTAFGELATIDAGECDGIAWFVGRNNLSVCASR